MKIQWLVLRCNNARKHSKATAVQVSIISNNGSIVLQVKDNGVGMPKYKLQTSNYKESNNGMGLKGMQERAKKINGEISFSSNNSQGTKVKLKVPVGKV